MEEEITHGLEKRSLMILKIMAAAFALYELYKMFNAETYAKIIEQIKSSALEEEEESAEIMQDPFFRKVLFIEIAYTAFAIVLLFTAYWYFILILLTVSLIVFTIDTAVKTSSVILGIGSAICAAVLVSIVLA